MDDIRISFETPHRTGKSLWQIFVPVADNNGNEFKILKHKEWDYKVKDIAGGLTINKRSRGIWQSPMTGKMFEEKMIPVSILCTYDEIEKIILMTLNHYGQQAVMCYEISDKIMIAERMPNGNS